MKKVATIFMALFLLLAACESAWGVICSNLTTPEQLHDATMAVGCPTITLDPSGAWWFSPAMIVDDPNDADYDYIPLWKDKTIKSKNSNSDIMMLIAQFPEFDLDNVVFKDIFPIFEYQKAVIALTSFNSDAGDFSAVFKGWTFCADCRSPNAGFELQGISYFVLGSVSGQKGYAFKISGVNDQSAGDTHIVSLEFHSQSTSPYIWVNAAEHVNASNNQFIIKNSPIIKVDEEEGFEQKIFVRGSNIFKEEPGALDLANLHTADPNTHMSNLGKPIFQYINYDNEYFYIKVVTPMTTESWGEDDIACPEKFYSRYVNLEPYYLNINDSEIKSAHSLWLKAPTKDGDDFYLKIKRDATSSTNKKGDPLVKVDFALLKDIPIAVVAHCEGYGSTVFSDQINLKVCDANEEYKPELLDCQTLLACGKNKDCPEGLMCVSDLCKECGVDADCTDQKLCKAGACTEPPQCATDLECDYEEICQDQQCIVKPIIACSTDADCDANNYCAGSTLGCLSCSDANPVNLICPGTSYTGQGSTVASECSDGSPPVCPVNSEAKDFCGGGCFCKDGYRSVGSMACVDKLTSRVCPMGYVLNSASQECMMAVNAPPSKKGGCNCSVCY